MMEHDVTGKPPRPIIETGMAHIPEDRQRHGLVLSFPVTDNLVLCTYYLSPFARSGVLNHEARDENGRQRNSKQKYLFSTQATAGPVSLHSHLLWGNSSPDTLGGVSEQQFDLYLPFCS